MFEAPLAKCEFTRTNLKIRYRYFLNCSHTLVGGYPPNPQKQKSGFFKWRYLLQAQNR